MTLDELIASGPALIKRAWVEEPGFQSLYVRYTPRYVLGARYDRVLVLANMTAVKEQSGALTALLDRLQRDYPAVPIVVENVHVNGVARWLERHGFINLDPHLPIGASYFRPSEPGW